MKSGILSLNKGLFQQQARSISWIAIFFALVLVIMLPLSMLIRHLTFGEEYYADYASYSFNPVFEFSFPFQLMAFATFPVLLGIILLNFTTKKASTDFMHSLPFTRQSILTHNYMVGTLAMLLPILLTGLLINVLRPFLTDKFFSILDTLEWMGISFLIVLIIFIFTIMIGMFAGSGLLHAGLTYVMIVVPATLIVLVLTNLQYYVNGLALTKYVEELFTNGVFFVRLAELLQKPFTLLEYGIYTLLASAFVAISYIAYARRPSEATEQSIVFPFFRNVFLYLLTFFTMLLAGVYFSEIQQGSIVWTLVGYLLGAFIAYTILQMILQKTLRLSWPWKGFVVYGIVVALLIIPVNFVAGFYEKAIPEASEVESASINQMYMEPSTNKKLTSEEAIQLVIDVHQTLIEQDIPNRMYPEHISITYNLKNGDTISREYRVNAEELGQITGELVNNEEFKLAYEPIFKVKTLTDLTFVGLWNSFGGEDQRITELDKIDELIQAIEKDTLENPSRFVTYSYYGGMQSIGELNFNRSSSREEAVYIPIYIDYTNTINWLIENGYGDTLLIPENIDSMVVLPTNDDEMRMKIDEAVYGGPHTVESLPDPKYVASDREEINDLYEAVQSGGEYDYTVFMQIGDEFGYNSFGFSEENAPDFLKEALPLP